MILPWRWITGLNPGVCVIHINRWNWPAGWVSKVERTAAQCVMTVKYIQIQNTKCKYKIHIGQNTELLAFLTVTDERDNAVHIWRTTFNVLLQQFLCVTMTQVPLYPLSDLLSSLPLFFFFSCIQSPSYLPLFGPRYCPASLAFLRIKIFLHHCCRHCGR